MNTKEPNPNKPTILNLTTLPTVDFKHPQIPPINPQQYYITSGDAITKTHYLLKTIGKTKVQAKKLGLNPTKIHKVLHPLVQATQKLLKQLTEIKGPFVFLETEWEGEGRLWVIPKNPRNYPG